MVKLLGRWAPLVGGLLLAASVVLPIFGQSELGQLLAGLATLTGVGSASPVSGAEMAQASVAVVAAVGVVWGAVRKFVSLYSAPKPPAA